MSVQRPCGAPVVALNQATCSPAGLLRGGVQRLVLRGLFYARRCFRDRAIHYPAGRRVRSIPFAHGFSTSAFGRPFGFAGRRSHSRAWSPETSKGPPFVSP